MSSVKGAIFSSSIFFLLATYSGTSVTEIYEKSDSKNEIAANDENNMTGIGNLKINPVERQHKKNSINNTAHPKIEILNDKIYFDSKILTFGASLESWRRVIGGHPRCFKDRLSWCVWDSYGLEVSTDSHATQKVKAITIYFAFEVKDPELAKVLTPTAEELYDWLPHQKFAGHLELDGFAIGAKSKFREIRSGVNANRLLNCGVFDCSNPAGAFSQNAHLYLVLDGRSENSLIRTFSVEVEDENAN